MTFKSQNTRQGAYYLLWTLPSKLLVCNNTCMHIHMMNNGNLQEKRKMTMLISQKKGIKQAKIKTFSYFYSSLKKNRHDPVLFVIFLYTLNRGSSSLAYHSGSQKLRSLVLLMCITAERMFSCTLSPALKQA